MPHFRQRARHGFVVFLLASVDLQGAAFAARTPLDNRAPDVNAPRAVTMPAGESELDFGLGAIWGANAPIQPITPVPQLFWVHGFTDRCDLLAGLFGGGVSAFGRYAICPGNLNVEAGFQAIALPKLAFEPLAELQLDLPLDGATVHLVPGVQPTFGATSALGGFALAGVETPLNACWDFSASVKATYSAGAPLDIAPSFGLRRNLGDHWAAEVIGLAQQGAPAALLLVGDRY